MSKVSLDLSLSFDQVNTFGSSVCQMNMMHSNSEQLNTIQIAVKKLLTPDCLIMRLRQCQSKISQLIELLGMSLSLNISYNLPLKVLILTGWFLRSFFLTT